MTGRPLTPEREAKYRRWREKGLPWRSEDADEVFAALDAARAEAREAEETCRQLAKRSAAHKREADTLRAERDKLRSDLNIERGRVEGMLAARDALAGRETPK